MRFLTPQEVATLADTVGPRYRALILTGAYGGLRWSELIGLRVDRVDPLKSTVQVAETLVEVRGHFMPPGPPKTRAGRRVVTIPRPVMQELVEHMARYSEPDGLVFVAPEGGPIHRSLFRSRVWLGAIRKAGVAPLRFHDLRHTAVAFWIAAGAHVKEICELTGHSSAAVVLDRYGHILPSSREKLTAKLEELYEAGADEAKILPFNG